MKPYYQDDYATIYHGDCLEIMPDLKPVDLIIADPPYSLGLQSNMKTSGWGDLMNGAFFYAEMLRRFQIATYVRQGAAWVFNNWRGLPLLAKASHEAEWAIESMLVWHKDWIGPGGTKGLRPSYEMVALFCQDQFKLENRGLPDMWTVPWSSTKPSGHPAEKPVKLIERLIWESGKGLILDPFCGSGTTLVAAKRIGGRYAIGIEIEEKYCELAANRLSQERLQFNP